MKMHILFGQRSCRYEGEYTFEALEIADEITMDDNSEWFEEKYEYYEKSNEFEALGVMIIKIKNDDIQKCLYPSHEAEVEVISK